MKKFSYFLGLVLAALALMPMSVKAQQIYPTLTFRDATGAQVRQVEATLNEDFIPPTLTCDEYPEVLRYVRYSSSNGRVAWADSISGYVELYSAGQTTITAYFAGDSVYSAARAMYTLIVNEPVTPPTPDTVTCPEAFFFYNGALVESITLKVGDVISTPMLMAATGSILSGRTSIENTNIARLTEDGMIQGVAEGTTRYHVLYYQTSSEGGVLTCEYDLGIIVEAAAPQKAQPELSFKPQEVSIELGDKVEVPTIVNPHNIALTPNNSKWYTAWDSQVAQVDEATGEVTILGIGDEIISFEFTGNDEYEAQIIGYNLHVTTMGLAVGGVIVNNSNKDDIFGDNGSITYDPITHTLTMTNAAVNGAGLNLAPARVKAAKADEQIEAAILYVDDAPLTIVLIGGNAIVNADAGISSSYAPVVMMSPEGEYGSVRISANTVGVKTQAFKLYKCNVSAFGGAAGVAVNELGVATGANLLAQGQGLAIQANSLIMAEDHDGEGIAILTEGVTFEKGKGFFKDGKVATLVEIGKVPVVAPEDEVTTIDFTQTDPEGNETVVFSTSVNDTYNETTGQLEISTQLTDAQVEEALESLVPGSSAWVDMLPGSLVFDIPAGEGELKVKCMTLPGYKLQVKIEGQAAVSVEMKELGWAKVSYNVAAPVHVVIYLHAPEGSSAPARIATRMQDAVEAHAYIEAVEIAPANAPQGLENIVVDGDQTTKVLFDGQLYIIREGHIFTVQGTEVK